MAYDIFISYKRKDANSRNTAPYIYDLLLHKGYNVFFDRKEMRSGKFDEQLLNHLDNATDIIILLGPDSLKSWFDYKDDERYKPRSDDKMGTTQEPPYKTDWFCREVMHALSLEGKNIIPLLLDGYKMPEAKDLPPELKALQRHNAIEVDICEIEDMYQKYFLGMEYLKSTPKNLALQRQYRNGGACVGQFLFYTDAASCELYECGEKIITLTDDNDRHHPFCRTVNFAGEHLFRLFNNDTCEEIEIEAVVETNSQKYVPVEWTQTQNIWELTDEDIAGQTDGDTLFFWGKWLYEGTEKNAPDIARSVQCFQRACDMGNEPAIDFMKSHGDADLESMNASDEDRFRWYKLSADLGSAEGQTLLGTMYEYEIGDEKKALELYSTAAEQGCAHAQVLLGSMYRCGLGVERDYFKAIRLYTRAAEQGALTAYNLLANMYLEGIGVNRSCEIAVRWYTKAAELGDAWAQYRLGEIYANGEGGGCQDYVKAVWWYTKAAEQGESSAQYRLGEMYANGEGVDQDYVKAVKWYSMAGIQGEDTASYSLGEIYEYGRGVEQSYEKAVEWYVVSAEMYNEQAQCRLGSMYEFGEGVEQDYSKAVDWYTKAAEQGNAWARYHLGEMYLCGVGVKQNIHYAGLLFHKAAEHGFVDAYNNLAWTYHLMGGYEKALPWALKAVENEPDNWGFIDTLATVYKGLGRYDEAIEQFERCLQLLEAGENNDEHIAETKAKIEEVKSLMGEA